MDYQKQANEFLENTGTTFTAEFIGHYPYFDEDKESRDVYIVTISRKGKTYSFKFGQSIANSGESANSGKYITRNPYYKLIHGHEPTQRKRIEPTAYDVLACLTKYDIGTFNDFCSDFGYDNDSRKAEELYFRVQNEYANVNRLFGDVIEQLQEIE